MTVEDTSVLFLLGAFALMLLITFARQLTDTWRRIILRFGVFEALLVVVGFLQWRVLARTDEALHLSATAQSASAQTTEKLAQIASKQTEISARQLDAMEVDKRPWIKITVTFAKPPRLSDWSGQKGLNVSLHFDLKNYGNSPAVNLRIQSPIVVHPGNPRRWELDAPQRDACDRARAEADKNPIGGVAIFPGESIPVEQGSGIFGIYKTNEPILFSILGCGDYTYAGNRHGQTGFRMILGHVVKGQIFGIPFVEGSLEPYEEPISPDLLAHGYPAVPPKVTLLQPDDFIFRADDGGNYAK
jgi:hypothetical protein